jgi:hypothetical protein
VKMAVVPDAPHEDETNHFVKDAESNEKRKM